MGFGQLRCIFRCKDPAGLQMLDLALIQEYEPVAGDDSAEEKELTGQRQFRLSQASCRVIEIRQILQPVVLLPHPEKPEIVFHNFFH